MAIREAAHPGEGSVLLARTDGAGRVILEMAEAVRQRIWDAAPAATELDVTADVRQMRQEDTRTSEENSRRRSQAGSDAVGAALLVHLGL